MKKYFLPSIAMATLGLLSACGNNSNRIAENLANANVANHYLDSMHLADSLSNYGPPIDLTFANVLDKANDGKRVSIEGYVTMPGTSYVSSDHAQLDFIERPNEFSKAFNFILSVNVGDENNTMKTLPDKYTSADIIVKGKKGEKIGVGDRVKITGKLSVSSDYCSITVQEIEKVEDITFDYSTLGATTITGANPATDALDKKLVMVEGMIDIPSLTMGGEYTFVYLKVPGIAENLTVDIAYGSTDSKLEPLPENYSEKDFKIHDKKGNIINTKKKVRIYGLWKDKCVKLESVENI